MLSVKQFALHPEIVFGLGNEVRCKARAFSLKGTDAKLGKMFAEHEENSDVKEVLSKLKFVLHNQQLWISCRKYPAVFLKATVLLHRAA